MAEAKFSMHAQQVVVGESLNVIALISGGKDSFFSLLHCLRNGHRVVALGNLYPPVTSSRAGDGTERQIGQVGDVNDEESEKDLNSFMYQTVGHTVIPTYEKLLGVPLYRQEISGGAVQTGTSYYVSSDSGSRGDVSDDDKKGQTDGDETESLVPLLQRIMKAHPEANAVCSGAILSTYQRTRIESVALRLGLVPLAYLWQYPVLPPHTQTSLLEDMYYAGLEARIVKVASGGIDEGWLWERVTEPRSIARLERQLRKFGVDSHGAAIGEGGEYETIVVDGPGILFKGRLKADRESMTVIKEGGGNAWLKIGQVEIEMKGDEERSQECRVPSVLEARFESLLTNKKPIGSSTESKSVDLAQQGPIQLGRSDPSIVQRTFIAERSTSHTEITEETTAITNSIRNFLQSQDLASTNIISSLILLRSMSDFQTVNQIYGSLFPHPNPPSRVTISCGDSLPANQNLQIYLTIYKPPSVLAAVKEHHKKTLHVQSRSYWAPANIGPYSQAISYASLSPLPVRGAKIDREEQETDEDDEEEDHSQRLPVWLVRIAGQIPLLPASMTLPEASGGAEEAFRYQGVLSLQHLWRIGIATGVKWFVGGVAYIPSSATASSHDGLKSIRKAQVVGELWYALHQKQSEEDEGGDEGEEIDVWDQRNNYSMQTQPLRETVQKLPEWALVPKLGGAGGHSIPAVFTVEVESLPRASGIEWHAFSGIAGGASRIVPRTYESPSSSFTIHHVVTNNYITHTIISIPLSDFATTSTESSSPSSSSYFDTAFHHAINVLNTTQDTIIQLGTLTYVNEKTKTALFENSEHDNKSLRWNGLVTCKGIWDAKGVEVAAIWVLEGIL